MYLFFLVISSFTLKLAASTSVHCPNHQLPCDNGLQCINREGWCDKNDDCDDKSDEAYCKEGGWFKPDPNKCKGTHFLCWNGKCVPKAAECDQHKDCEDESDEENCDDSNEKKIPTLETSSEESSSSSDSGSESESSGEVDGNGFSIEKSTVFIDEGESKITSTEKPTESSSFSQEQLPSSTSFYERRLKEMERSSTREISAPTSQQPVTLQTPVSVASHTISTRVKILLSTSPVPPTRSYYNYSRPVNRYPSVKTYPKPADPANRHSTFVNRPPVYNTKPPTYIRRPSKYDDRPSAYGRFPSTYDNRQLTYDRHPSTSSRYASTSDRYPSGHGVRPSTYGRISTPYNERSSNILNGEPDWRQVESLKPYKRETDVISSFSFAKDYAKLYGQRNSRQLREAKSWLLGQRDSSGGWGKDTPRALIALALSNGNFSKGISENELMKRNFLVQLGINVLSNNSKDFSLNRLSMAMNALLAVCENPRDFHGIDLTEVMNAKMREYFKSRPRPYINPFIYLSLCLSGKTLGSSEVQTLMKQMHASPSTSEFNKDMQSVAIQAFACYAHQNSHDLTYRRSLQTMLQDAVSDLLKRMLTDGSFGSVYSTSLAAQALISVNDSGSWEAEKTLNFIKQQQRENGSFGDLLATYYALPVISGRSLLHLRNIQCEPAPIVRDLTPSEILDFAGPRQYVHYSIYFNNPLTNSYSMRVLVPEGINLLDMMRVAEHQDSNFRFAYEESDRNLQVYSVSGLPNDPEQGLTWHLYVKREYESQQYDQNSRELYTGDIRKYLPKSDDHVILWYHPNRLHK